VIRALAAGQPVRRLCDLLAVAPSSYYYQARPDDDLSVLAWIEEVLLEFPPHRTTTSITAGWTR
jgi:hypothetical protein